MKYIILLIIIFSAFSFAQTDWERWGKADISYKIPDNITRNGVTLSGGNAGQKALHVFADAYWYLISDVDGDNCSFNPTCSHFFLLAVHSTNIFQGTLMFFDRFTRDMNIFKQYEYYPRVMDGHFYDPVSLYALKKKQINYIPPSVVVNK